jgi:hypothetical protein
MRDATLRVWKKSIAGSAGDVVEFAGTLRPEDGGTVIEGTLRYRMHTRIQFIGLLATGLILGVAGALQKLHGTAADGSLLWIGCFVLGLTLIWIHAGSQTRHMQIDFIADRLEEAVAASRGQTP